MEAGFIGVGQMGGPMAINLSASYPVTAFCFNDADLRTLKSSTVVTTNNVLDLVTKDIIFLCLPNIGVIEDLLFGAHALASHLRPGVVIVDTSTSEYSATLSIAARLHALDIKFVDAPVSGMQARAEDGSLTMMCGGDESLVESIKPLLLTMASTVLYMGQVGSGQLTKLVNQLLFDINAAALAEILPLSVKLGLDPEKIGDVVNSGTGRSFASEFFIPNILSGDFSNGYPMQDAYKDLISGSDISTQHQIPTPVLAAAIATYQTALLAGHGEKDKGGMICVYEDLLGVKFRTDTAEN